MEWNLLQTRSGAQTVTDTLLTRRFSLPLVEKTCLLFILASIREYSMDLLVKMINHLTRVPWTRTSRLIFNKKAVSPLERRLQIVALTLSSKLSCMVIFYHQRIFVWFSHYFSLTSLNSLARLTNLSSVELFIINLTLENRVPARVKDVHVLKS